MTEPEPYESLLAKHQDVGFRLNQREIDALVVHAERFRKAADPVAQADHDRALQAAAWAEGANAAVKPVNTGTRMTLQAVIPFPSNPYVHPGEPQ